MNILYEVLGERCTDAGGGVCLGAVVLGQAQGVVQCSGKGGRAFPPAGLGVEWVQRVRGEGRCRRGLQLRTDGLPPFVLCCPGDWLLVFKNGNIVGLHCCVGLHLVLLSTVLVSGGQQSEQVYIYILFHCSLLQVSGYSSLCYTVIGPCLFYM